MATIREVTAEERPFRRQGMGWVFSPPDAPVILAFDRIDEKGGDTWAEVHVTLRDGGHLARRRVNLLGGTSFSTFVKELASVDGGGGWPWQAILSSGCESTLEAHRAGEPVRILGRRVEPPPPVRYLVPGLVVENGANTWFGPGGTGKSTAAATLCVSMSLGEPFLGLPVRRGVALYLDWEDEEETAEAVIWEAQRGYGVLGGGEVLWRRMSAPLRHGVAEIAALIDRHGVTLLVIDSATRAMGASGEGTSYETAAIAFAESIRALGKVTTLIIDHVDGATVKEGTVAKKAYGSIHKLNFVRNAWSLTPDLDARDRGRQIVGWTHAKVNRSAYSQPFGVLYERGDDAGLRLLPMEAVDVQPLQDAMPQWRKLLTTLERCGPLEVKEAARELFGNDDERACKHVRALFSRDHGKHMVRLPDGRLSARYVERNTATSGAQHVADEPNLRVVARDDDDVEELPW